MEKTQAEIAAEKYADSYWTRDIIHWAAAKVNYKNGYEEGYNSAPQLKWKPIQAGENYGNCLICDMDYKKVSFCNNPGITEILMNYRYYILVSELLQLDKEQ